MASRFGLAVAMQRYPHTPLSFVTTPIQNSSQHFSDLRWVALLAMTGHLQVHESDLSCWAKPVQWAKQVYVETGT